MSRITRDFQYWMPRLRWQAVRIREALGLWGLLAIGAIAVVLLIELVLIGQGFELDVVRRREIQAGITEQPQDLHVTAPIVVEKLPAAQAFALRLEKVLTLIQQQGFRIDQTSLTYSTPGDSSLQRLDVEIPLDGSYLALRKTLADVAGETGVRIENLTLERKQINLSSLSITLKLSLLGVTE